MNLEQINELIINYNKLIDLAKSKIKVIEGIDSQYNTARGIEEISFDIDAKTVYVKCDDSCRGCYDSLCKMRFGYMGSTQSIHRYME